MKQECWESISTHFTAFPDLGLPFFECFDIFSFFGFFQFFEKDFKKLAWVTQNMTWMIFQMTQVTSFTVKMTFKRMRYRPTNQPLDRPTESDVESLHATNNRMWGNEAGVLREHFNTFYCVSWPWTILFLTFWHFSIFWFFQFFEKDFKKLAWVTQNMTWMILRMTQVNSFMVKMTFKQMRYQPTNQPTDEPTEWDIESLHATKN